MNACESTSPVDGEKRPTGQDRKNYRSSLVRAPPPQKITKKKKILRMERRDRQRHFLSAGSRNPPPPPKTPGDDMSRTPRNLIYPRFELDRENRKKNTLRWLVTEERRVTLFPVRAREENTQKIKSSPGW